MYKTSSIKQLGTVLQQADLVSSTQVKIALREQSQSTNKRIGEILARRGWLKQETADFFAEQWPNLLSHRVRQPLGQYLKKAALLSERQIEAILFEQKQTKLRFGELAVEKGGLSLIQSIFFLLIWLFKSKQLLRRKPQISLSIMMFSRQYSQNC